MMILLAILCWTNFDSGVVSDNQIKDSVARFVSERMNARSEEYLLEFGSLPLPRVEDQTGCIVRVAEDAVLHLRGRVGIPMELVVRGAVQRRFVVPVRIRTFGNVCVTERLVQRHEIFDTGSFAVQRVETTDLQDDLVKNAAELVDVRSARIISAHSILHKSMVEKIPAVRRNDIVIIAVRTLQTSISVQGVAQQDGCVGDLISIQKVGTHDRLKARVVNAHTVAIDLEQEARGENKAKGNGHENTR